MHDLMPDAARAIDLPMCFRHWCMRQAPMDLAPQFDRPTTRSRERLGAGRLPLFVELRRNPRLTWCDLRVTARWGSGLLDTLFWHRVRPEQYALRGDDDVMQPLPNWYDVGMTCGQQALPFDATYPSLAALLSAELFAPWWRWLTRASLEADWLVLSLDPQHRPRAELLAYADPLSEQTHVLAWHDLRGLQRIPPWPEVQLKCAQGWRRNSDVPNHGTVGTFEDLCASRPFP